MPAWRLEQALRRRGVLVDEPAARGGAQRLRRKTRRAQRFRGSGSLLTRLHLARVQPTTNDPWHLGRVSPPSSLSQSASQPVIAPVTAPVTRPAGCECGPCHCGAPSSGCRRARRASPVAPACLAAGFNHPLWVTVPHWSGDKESAEHTHSGRAGAFGPQVPDLPLKFFSVSPDCCPSNVRVMGVIKVHTHVSSRDHMATNALKSNPTTQEARYQVWISSTKTAEVQSNLLCSYAPALPASHLRPRLSGGGVHWPRGWPMGQARDGWNLPWKLEPDPEGGTSLCSVAQVPHPRLPRGCSLPHGKVPV